MVFLEEIYFVREDNWWLGHHFMMESISEITRRHFVLLGT